MIKHNIIIQYIHTHISTSCGWDFNATWLVSWHGWKILEDHGTISVTNSGEFFKSFSGESDYPLVN
jgi:hypothetical protein